VGNATVQADSGYAAALDLYLKDAPIWEVGQELRRARRELDHLTERAVQRAVGRETWETIGRSLGVTRQAARKKYGPT
jgi:hypothetical protein